MSFLRKRVEDNKMRHSEVRMFILKYFARSTRSARRNYERFYKSQICIQTVSPAANAVHQAGSSLRYDMLNAKMFRTEYTECTEKLWYTSPQPSPPPFFIFHFSLFTLHFSLPKGRIILRHIILRLLLAKDRYIDISLWIEPEVL